MCRLCREFVVDNPKLAAICPTYKRVIGCVSGMQNMLRGLAGTPGEACWYFWLFVEEFRNCTSVIDATDMMKRCASLFVDEHALWQLPPSVRRV